MRKWNDGMDSARAHWVGGVVSRLLVPPAQMRAVGADACSVRPTPLSIRSAEGVQGCPLSVDELAIGMRVRAEPTTWECDKP